MTMEMYGGPCDWEWLWTELADKVGSENFPTSWEELSKCYPVRMDLHAYDMWRELHAYDMVMKAINKEFVE